jgi:hydrogenase maturation protease
MPELRHQLLAFRRQPTLWVGVGSHSYGDDSAGLNLAQQLAESGIPHVVSAGISPERWIATAQFASFAHVVFLDAVELGAQPGSMVLLTADEIAARFPQVSTHKISLGLLARYVQSQSAARAWLLGIQPQSLRHGRSPDIAGQPPDLALLCSALDVGRSALDLRRSALDVGRWTFDVGRSALDVRRSASSKWPSTPDDPEPLRPAPNMAPPNLLSLSAPVQFTVHLLHQLITECSNEPAEPAAVDRNAALSVSPQ